MSLALCMMQAESFYTNLFTLDISDQVKEHLYYTNDNVSE